MSQSHSCMFFWQKFEGIWDSVSFQGEDLGESGRSLMIMGFSGINSNDFSERDNSARAAVSLSSFPLQKGTEVVLSILSE